MRRRTTSRGIVAAGLVLVAGCASSRLPAVTGTPVVDPAAVAADLSIGSVPERPFQVNFDWTLEEGGSRASGKGVVRVEAPERIRLDLFGPRGETYLAAALTEGVYRFPSTVRSPIELPSAVLLWGALGIFQLPAGAALSSATVDGSSTDLRYAAPGGDLYLFTFTSEGASVQSRLQRVERAIGQGVVESVSIIRGEDGAVTRTEYRDWSAFRNLTLIVETRRDVDPFPPEIWRPDA